MNPTGAADSRPEPHARAPFRAADFDCLAEALDYAAEGGGGLNFHGLRGERENHLSYAEVRARALYLARGMMAQGLKRGDRVAIIADMHPDFVCAFFACQYAGLLAAPMPLPTALGGRDGYVEQLRISLKASGARIALGPEALIPQLEDAGRNLGLALIGTVAGLVHVNGIGRQLEPLGANEASHIQYSSGSTTHPRGILIGQSALMANAKAVAQHGLRITPDDRCASWLPFYHDMGLIGFMVIPMSCQVSIDYYQTDGFARRPLQWLELMSRNACTIAFSPAFGYDLCVRRAASARDLDLDLSRWRVAGIGGEMIRPNILNDFARVFEPYGFRAESFVPSYGLAESTLAVSVAPLDTRITVDVVDRQALVERNVAVRPGTNGNGNGISNGNGNGAAFSGNGIEGRTDKTRRLVACGHPLPGHTVEVRDAANSALPERCVGRIFVKGPSVMSGYDRNSVATDGVLDRDGWLSTGDMGYLTGGQLVITGRQKDLIIYNGRNIWPQDLEWEAEQLPEVRNRGTAAFSIEDNDGKETPVILVECRTQDSDARIQLVSMVRSAVFRKTAIDCHVGLIPPRSLPYTTSGKLRRAKAKQTYLAKELECEARPRPGNNGQPSVQRTQSLEA